MGPLQIPSNHESHVTRLPSLNFCTMYSFDGGSPDYVFIRFLCMFNLVHTRTFPHNIIYQPLWLVPSEHTEAAGIDCVCLETGCLCGRIRDSQNKAHIFKSVI
ncbi:hypothetical protein ATANTOWER_005657 [Ataeniobius toweri]|uniref:Uncharacterized protein n=1 Tax=Ataeniobius toweri TaxID=208326 RepID=A0ABU7BMY9_9TELE|nr:hypothetical protein [Ataeniobius toweri]